MQLANCFINSNSANSFKAKWSQGIQDQVLSLGIVGEAHSFLSDFRASAMEALLADLDIKKRLSLIDGSEEALKSLNFRIDKMRDLKGNERARLEISKLSKSIDEISQASKEYFVLLREARFESDLLAKKYFVSQIVPNLQIAQKEFSLIELVQAHATKSALQIGEPQSQFNFNWVVFLTIGTFWAFGLILLSLIARKLRQVTLSVDASARSVSVSAKNLSLNSRQLSTGARQQASTLVEAASSLEEISEIIETNVSHTEDSLSFAKNAKSLTEETNATILSLSTSMSEILKSNERIEVFSTRIEEIGEKTEMIDDIVFQTKILSFNASVEAERAGEMGRGFGVVAQEVGNLAALSGQSAIEIAAIVKSAMKESQEIIAENKLRVKKGAELCQLSVTKMKAVRDATEKILSSCEQVLRASKEQSSSIRQVSTTVDSLSQATQSNSESAQTLAGSSHHLSQLSSSLNSQVLELHLLIESDAKKEKDSPLLSDVKLVPLKQKFKIKAVEMKKVSGESSAWDKL